MPVVKCTMQFQYASNSSSATGRKRTAGPSESYYRSGTISSVEVPFFVLCQYRAALLPIGSSIIAQRYQVVDGVGASLTTNKIIQAGSGLKASTPQTCLHCRIGASDATNVRSLDLRMIPDDIEIEGEYVVNRTFETALFAFVERLGSSNFKFYGIDKTSARVKLISITQVNPVPPGLPYGAYVTQSPTYWIGGDMLQVSGSKNAAGQVVGGFGPEGLASTSTTGTILGWTKGNTNGGSIRRYRKVLCSIDPASFAIIEIIEKKVGPSSRKYRGRRSKRRV